MVARKIGSGEKFAVIALSGRVPSFEKPIELGHGVEVWPTSPLEISDNWESYPGKRASWHFRENANIFIVARRQSDSHDTDLEAIALSREAKRIHIGLYSNTPGFFATEGWAVEGYVHDSVTYASQYRQLFPMFCAPGAPGNWGIDERHVRTAKKIAEALLQTHPLGEYDRLGRVNFALSQALTSPYMTSRLQQSVRALEGLVFPPEDTATRKIFADRAQLFVGNEHADLLRDLYAMRGRIEHLHGPIAAVRRVRADADDTEIMLLLAFATFVAENLAKACVTRVYREPKLWPHFASDEALHAFWSSKGKGRLWGEKIDLGRIARTFDKSEAARGIDHGERASQPDKEADRLSRVWRGLDAGEGAP